MSEKTTNCELCGRVEPCENCDNESCPMGSETKPLDGDDFALPTCTWSGPNGSCEACQ